LDGTEQNGLDWIGFELKESKESKQWHRICDGNGSPISQNGSQSSVEGRMRKRVYFFACKHKYILMHVALSVVGGSEKRERNARSIQQRKISNRCFAGNRINDIAHTSWQGGSIDQSIKQKKYHNINTLLMLN